MITSGDHKCINNPEILGTLTLVMCHIISFNIGKKVMVWSTLKYGYVQIQAGSVSQLVKAIKFVMQIEVHSGSKGLTIEVLIFGCLFEYFASGIQL